jgi:DNA mismatch endonuclease, patch repair protein
MVDVFDKRKRSWLMSRIPGRNTKPEIQLAKLLRAEHLEYRRHYNALPGTPDAALPRERIAVFIQGCFWHGHHGCSKASMPTTNRTFWRKKIRSNTKRDMRQARALRKLGWSVALFWTCRPLTRERLRTRIRQIVVRRMDRGSFAR